MSQSGLFSAFFTCLALYLKSGKSDQIQTVVGISFICDLCKKLKFLLLILRSP